MTSGVTRRWKVYGFDGHRQRESFNQSQSYDFSDEITGIRKIEVQNSDVTGTNDYTLVVITRNAAEECWDELMGQLSDGIFENSRTGYVEEVWEHLDHTEEELQPVIDSYIGANTAMSEEQWYDWITKESEEYGADLTDTDKEYIVGKLEEAYLVYRDWYAVLKDREDADWGYGSYDIDEAFEMAKEFGGEAYIAVIRERKGYAAECVEELEVE